MLWASGVILGILSKIMLEIQTILQKNLQTTNMVSDYW